MNLPSTSAIPGALVQLLAIVAAALPQGTTVYFGPEMTAYQTPLTFEVTEITGDQKVAELGVNFRREESFAFVCTLTAYQGGAAQDFSGQLTALMSSFSLLAIAIANNPTLNQTVRFAEPGNFDILPAVDPNSGAGGISLDFMIRCQQRVTTLS